MKHRTLPTIALVASLLIALPAAAQMGPAPAHVPDPIHVSHCNPTEGQVYAPGFVPGYYPGTAYYWGDVYGRTFYQPPVTNNPTLAIDYVNTSEKVISSIEFGLIARGQLVAEVRDVGTFSPGAEIKHKFGISQNVFPLGTALPQCLPLRITFKDGTKWRSRHLPALQSSLYH